MWATVLVSLCTLVLVLYLWGGRLILRICSLVLKNWRLTSRGFEWDDDPNVVVPTFLARRLNFEWGGWTEWRRGTSGLMVMKVSGISYRQRRKTVDAGDKKQEVAPSVSWCVGRWLIGRRGHSHRQSPFSRRLFYHTSSISFYTTRHGSPVSFKSSYAIFVSSATTSAGWRARSVKLYWD